MIVVLYLNAFQKKMSNKFIIFYQNITELVSYIPSKSEAFINELTSLIMFFFVSVNDTGEILKIRGKDM